MSAFETTAVNGLLKGLLVTVLVGMLMACGGGGGGSSSESVVARGVITNLGSIWVNGVRYETPDGGTYSNDDSTSTIASYEVGQVVSLRGTRNSDGTSGTADEVIYEAEIEGTASAGNIINGVTIITDGTLAINTLVIGTRYEVSGFWINDTTLQATFIKEDDDSGAGGDGIDEIKGSVDAVDITGTMLTVRGNIYTYSGTPVVSVGDLVEIHFDPNPIAPNMFLASEVELEDDFLDGQDDGQEVEVEGTVILLDPANPGTCPAGAKFTIDATCIDWDFVDSWEDGLDSSADMASGLRVEVEGHFNAAGDLLIAEEIKGRGNRVRISATVNNFNIADGTLTVFGSAIQVTIESGLTDIEDPISDGGGFEIRGIRTGATSMLALRIKDDGVNSSNHELRAEVDLNGVDFSSSPNIVTVMGISSIVDSNTQLEDEDMIFAPGGGTPENIIDDFLESIDDDDDVTNGPRDEIEVRVDILTGIADQVEIEREDD